MNSSEKNIFISAKRSNCTKIFKISKIKKPKYDSNYSSDDSKLDSTHDKDSQSTLSSPTLSPKKQSSLREVNVPSFFNDLSFLPDIKTKLKKYDKVFSEFEDIEDREIYLVRKESLFSV